MLGLDVHLQRRCGIRKSKKGANGRKGYRKIDRKAAEEFLLANSKPTCQLYCGSGKRRAGAEARVRQKRSLIDSKRQLHLSSGLDQQISLSTWYRSMKCLWPEYCCTKRVLDKCGKCHQWDEQVMPMIKVSLAQWREDLQALLPTYWAKWDAELEQRFQDHEVEQLSMGFLEGLRDYVDRGPTRRPDGLSLETLLALHTTEAQVRHELDTAYSRMPERVGLVETVAMHSFHFLVRDHQNETFLEDFHNPEPNSLYMMLDFKQHDTLPLGPSGSYFVVCAVSVAELCVMLLRMC